MPELAQPADKPHKIRVLIVDDIPETRENLRKLLFFETDIEVVGAATSGEEGIALAGELKPDIVLMDINMPGVDGIKATEAITQQVPTAQVIMMSVQGETDYLRRSMQAGAREFLVKPFSSNDLITGIRRVYELGATRRQAAAVTAIPTTPGPVSHERAPQERGKILTVFSPKGGTGCSTIAINLAIALRQMKEGVSVALVDNALRFGDVAVLLNMQVTRSIVDLVPHIDELDSDLLDNVMLTHHSGVKALLAPPRPEMADLVAPKMVEKVLYRLRTLFNYVIVDTASTLDDVTLAALDVCDRILLVATPDVPAVKDAKLFCELTEALEYPPSKTVMILNKADPRTGIRAEDIQAHIKHPVAVQLPIDEPTATYAANQGIPYLMSARQSKLAQATVGLAQHLASVLVEK